MFLCAKLYIVLCGAYEYYAVDIGLVHMFRLCVSSDASPANRDGTCSYDADTSVAFDAGDRLAFDFGNDTDV